MSEYVQGIRLVAKKNPRITVTLFDTPESEDSLQAGYVRLAILGGLPIVVLKECLEVSSYLGALWLRELCHQCGDDAHVGRSIQAT